MKHLFLALTIFLTPACLTGGDLARLRDAQFEFEQTVTAALGDANATSAQTLSRVKEANDLRVVALETTLEDVRTRTEEAVSIAGKTVTGSGALDMAGQLLIPALLGGLGLNHHRNQKRLMRGESTGSTPPAAT